MYIISLHPGIEKRKIITEGIARLENIVSVVKSGGGVIENDKHLRNWPQIFGIHEVRDAKPSHITDLQSPSCQHNTCQA
jgi:hypothetical protein